MGPLTSKGTCSFVPMCSLSPAECGMRGSGPSTVEGGGQGWDDSHAAEIADLRVPGQQERQDRRAGARQAEADQWRHDRDVVGVGMPPVPVLDLKPVDEMFDESGVDDRLAGGVQARLVVQ